MWGATGEAWVVRTVCPIDLLDLRAWQWCHY